MTPPTRHVLLALLVVGQLAVGAGAVAGTPNTGGTAAPPWTDPHDRGSAVPTGAAVDAVADRAVAVAESMADVAPVLLIPPPGLARGDDAEALEHETRRRLYERVVDSPGTYVTALAASIDVPASTVRYHVRVLEAETLVETRKIRGRRRVLPTDGPDARLAAALTDDSTARIIAAIDRDGPVSVTDLAETVDRARSTVSHHASRLHEAGLVERERDGRRVLLSLAEPVADRLDDRS